MKGTTSAFATPTYYFYDKANQLTVKGTTSKFATPTYYLYDKNGSVTNMVPSSGAATYFAYNTAGLVARIKWADATATYFFYDGALRRYGMNANGTMTYFLWNGPNLLQELNPDGTVKEEHTNAMSPIPGIGQVVEVNRPGQTQQKIYPVMDMRGTITKWIQSDGSTVFAAREYDAFGTIIPNSLTGTWPGRCGYQGQAWIEITSNDGTQRLLLSPTRIYNPNDGIFTQKDPLIKYLITGKELDPDFVDFNSVNGRYQFPARFYFPFRGVSARVDPISRYRMIIGTTTDILRNSYRFVSSSPTVHVDPTGLQEEMKPLKECVECFELLDDLLEAALECKEMLGGPPQRSAGMYASCVLAKIGTKLDKLKACWECIKEIVEFLKELFGELFELLKNVLKGIRDLWDWLWTSATTPHWVYVDPTLPPEPPPYPRETFPTQKKPACCVNYCPPRILEVLTLDCPPGYSHRYPVPCNDLPANLGPYYPGLRPSD